MSNALMTACRPLQMPPTAKAVLMALADRANDGGDAWPSIGTLVTDTCFRRTAVIAAVKFLESMRAVVADRSNGRHTSYKLTPDTFNQSTTRTGTADGPVRLANPTGPGNGRDQSGKRTAPVRQTDTNHKEPSRTHKSIPKILLPEWLEPELWESWVLHRKQKNGKGWTHEAQKACLRMLTKARDDGHTPSAIIENAIACGWTGLYPPNSKHNNVSGAGGQITGSKDFGGGSSDEHIDRLLAR